MNGPAFRVLPLAALALVVACAGSAPAESSAAPSASVIESSSGSACDPVELLTPSGERLDLTGTWTGGDALIVVHQYGECIWMESLSSDARFPLGTLFRRLYFGRIGDDFTIEARFGNLHYDGAAVQAGYVVLPEGEVVCEVAFANADGVETVVLRVPKVESVESGAWPLLDYSRISQSTELVSEPATGPE